MMKKMLLVVLLLSGCAGGPAVLSQAQLPMPEIEPEPSFPVPSYTPAGAGASPLGVPWQEPPAEVPRSPNKRLLTVDPTDPAPGLWAADEVKGSTLEYPMVADVELPMPVADDTNLEAPSCAYKISRLLKREGQMRQLMELSYDDRRCVIAQLNSYCWETEFKNVKSVERRNRLEGAASHLLYFLNHACRNTRPGKRVPEMIRKAVQSVWEIADKKGTRRR